MKKTAALFVVLLALISISTGCSDKKSTPVTSAPKNAVLKVGATPLPHGEILKVIQPMLAREGVELRIVEFTDYIRPNVALAEKELDANFFQHIPYLQQFATDRGLALTYTISVHIEPMGIYSKKIKKP